MREKTRHATASHAGSPWAAAPASKTNCYCNVVVKAFDAPYDYRTDGARATPCILLLQNGKYSASSTASRVAPPGRSGAAEQRARKQAGAAR